MDGFIVLIYILLFIIVCIDIKKKIIPNKYLILLMVIIFILKWDQGEVERTILGGSVYSVPFWFIYGYGSDIFNKECIGFGDVKLSFVIGMLKGYSSFYDVLVYLNIVSILPLLYICIYFLITRKFQKEIAFAPYVIGGYFISEMI